MNKKGFVLTEVLAVSVFIVSIFVFMYTSMMPLMGTYQDKALREYNIDIVYKTYHIRNMVYKDKFSDEILANNVKFFDCNDLHDANYCKYLVKFFDLTKYSMVYIKNISSNRNYFRNLDSEIYDYLGDYLDEEKDVILLIDHKEHTIAHIRYSA